MEDIALKVLLKFGKLILDNLENKLISNWKGKDDVAVQRIINMFKKELDLVNLKIEASAKSDVFISLECLQNGLTLLKRYDNEQSKFFLKKANKHFHTSLKHARKASHNYSLQTKDRIYAVKLKIIANILEDYTENPEEQLSFIYINTLKQLNDDAVIIANFKTLFVDKPSIVCNIIRKWCKTQRKDLVFSVVLINRKLWKYANDHDQQEWLSHWPCIQLDPNDKLHPVTDDRITKMFPPEEYNDSDEEIMPNIPVRTRSKDNTTTSSSTSVSVPYTRKRVMSEALEDPRPGKYVCLTEATLV